VNIAILKTAALGDVVRTTSILPGLVQRYPGARVLWVTAPGALDLVRTNALLTRVETLSVADPSSVGELAGRLATESFDRVLSFDDEEPVCRLATRLAGGDTEKISGAYFDEARGERRYSNDCAPWFDMGLLSVHGKDEADRRKRANTETHPAIFAAMLGIEKGEPELELTEEARAFGAAFRKRHELARRGLAIGLNTGSGGRWDSKKLSVECTVEIARRLAGALDRPAVFLLTGGPEEGVRNAAIAAGLEACEPPLHWIDTGTDNSLLEFAALVDGLDLLLTSDSLALHIANARRVPIVAFFAPTPAAEIDLYGRGLAVRSTAPDYASYKRDADTSSLTPERIVDACLQVLAR